MIGAIVLGCLIVWGFVMFFFFLQISRFLTLLPMKSCWTKIIQMSWVHSLRGLSSTYSALWSMHKNMFSRCLSVIQNAVSTSDRAFIQDCYHVYSSLKNPTSCNRRFWFMSYISFVIKTFLLVAGEQLYHFYKNSLFYPEKIQKNVFAAISRDMLGLG